MKVTSVRSKEYKVRQGIKIIIPHLSHTDRDIGCIGFKSTELVNNPPNQTMGSTALHHSSLIESILSQCLCETSFDVTHIMECMKGDCLYVMMKHNM